MDQAPAGDYRPSGLVYVLALDERPDGTYAPTLRRTIDNPSPTGRANISNATLFTDGDKFGYALAACDLGVFCGVPYADWYRDARDNRGKVLRIAGGGDLFIPQVPMPAGARLGHAIASNGSTVVAAGAPGAQQVVVYEWVVGARARVQILRPPWEAQQFGSHVRFLTDDILQVWGYGERVFTFAKQDAFWWFYNESTALRSNAVEVGRRVVSYHNDGVVALSSEFEPSSVPLRVECPPQYVSIAAMGDTRFAVGDLMGGMGAQGLVHFFEMEE